MKRCARFEEDRRTSDSCAGNDCAGNDCAGNSCAGNSSGIDNGSRRIDINAHHATANAILYGLLAVTCPPVERLLIPRPISGLLMKRGPNEGLQIHWPPSDQQPLNRLRATRNRTPVRHTTRSTPGH